MECAFGLRYALSFGTKRGEVPSDMQAIFWSYRAFLGANVSDRCLEDLGAKLRGTTPLILGAMLGPVRLQDGSQGAWEA